MILLLFGTAGAFEIQPVKPINLLENPSFDVTYVPDTEIFDHAQATEHVVHWWGNNNPGDWNYYPLWEKGVNQDEQIEFERDPSDEDNVFIHFRKPEPINSGNFLVYRRSPDSNPLETFQTELIYPYQWQASDVTLKFRAKGDAGLELTVSLSLYSTVVHADEVFHQPDQNAENTTVVVTLSPTWTEHTIEVPSSFPVKSIDLRFGFYESDANDDDPFPEAWIDDVRLHDDLLWVAPTAEAKAVTIHPEGQLLLGNSPEELEPFPVLGVQDRYAWIGKTAPLDSLRDRCQALGANGAEFNTLLKPPSGLNMYRTKREAYLVLDAALAAGMKAILWLPLYPPIPEEHKQIGLPLVHGLVEEWIEEFDDHPALLGWTYGDEKPEGQINTAIDHYVFTSYEKSIYELGAKFRPIFLFTADGPFEDASGMNCWGSAPAGCLDKMFQIAHVLMPNYYPLRASHNDPGDVIPLLSQWSWSKAIHHYGFGILYPPPPEEPWVTITRAVLPIMQLRPLDRSHAPPGGDDSWVMAAQAAGGKGVGAMAVTVGIANLEDGSNPTGPNRWDLLQPANRAAWDAAFQGQASQLFGIVPDVNRMATAIMEKRFEGDPSIASLPPKVVTHAAPKPGSGTWTVEDSWIAPEDPVSHDNSNELKTGYTCNKVDVVCSGFSRIRFLGIEDDDIFDAARTEEANLLLTIQTRALAGHSGLCAITNCPSYSTPMSHVSRIPSPDSLTWINDEAWTDFLEEDEPPNGVRVFSHIYKEGVPDEEQTFRDMGLQFLASGRRDYGQRAGIIEDESVALGRVVDFDLTNLVRYWASEPVDKDRNNGVLVQPYGPGRIFEPHLLYEADGSEGYAPPSVFLPSIFVYEVPAGETPKELGAPFALFYEAPPASVRIFELAHLASGQGESWILAVNSKAEEQCLRIYSNGHPEDPPIPSEIEVVSPLTGSVVATIPAWTSSARYVNFGPGWSTPDICPADESDLPYGIDYLDPDPPIHFPWHPDQPEHEKSYQPITRWDLTLPPSFDAFSAALIRIPHPS